MAEVSLLAYEDLRYHIQETWNYVELQDDTDATIVRLSTSDSRVSWVHATKMKTVGYDDLDNPIQEEVPDTNTLQLEIVITGSDSDITLPVTFAKSVIQNELGEDLSVEAFTPFEMTQAEDQITITHSIQVPQIV